MNKKLTLMAICGLLCAINSMAQLTMQRTGQVQLGRNYYEEEGYVPILREDLVWVGTCRFGDYHIKVAGDTVFDGVTYKKVYRKLNQASIELDPDYAIYTYFAYRMYYNNFTPAACLREADGKVYRYCDYDGFQFNFESLLDSFNHEWEYDYNIANSSDTHYEVLLYDFDNPNVYKNVYPLQAKDDVVVEDKSRRVFMDHNELSRVEEDEVLPWLMIEGLGMLSGGVQGCDMLCPGRSDNARNRDASILGTYYVRNSKGDVLFFNDLWSGSDSYYEIRFYAPDPYDFSEDGAFDIDDVNTVINIMLRKQEDDSSLSADLTFDGSVDIEDMNLVINRLLSGVKPVKYSELLAPEEAE